MIHIFPVQHNEKPENLSDLLCDFIHNNNLVSKKETVYAACVKEIVPETFITQTFVPAVEKTISRTGICKSQIRLITNRTCPSGSQPYPYHSNLEFYCGLTYYLSAIENANGYNSSWNSESSSALFLTGKPYKESRVSMLYMLTQRPVFRDLKYSFSGCLNSNAIAQECQSLLNAIDPRLDYVEFAEKYQQQLDIPGDQALYSSEAYHYSGFPTDISLYADTAFSIIAETSMGEQRSWTTEKTWRAIANHHPFLVLDKGANHRYLKSLGIKTFEKFYRHSLDTIRNSNRKQLISYYADNAQYFMDIKHKHEDEINHMVEHNFDQFTHIALRDFETTLNGDSDFREQFFAVTAHGNLSEGFTT